MTKTDIHFLRTKCAADPTNRGNILIMHLLDALDAKDSLIAEIIEIAEEGLSSTPYVSPDRSSELAALKARAAQ